MFEITTTSYVCEMNVLVCVTIRWLMSLLYQDNPVYPSTASIYPAQAVRLNEVGSQVPSTKFCRPVVHGSYI